MSKCLLTLLALLVFVGHLSAQATQTAAADDYNTHIQTS